MCGVTGFVQSRPDRTADELGAIVGAMTDPLTHRGPDDSGAWVDAEHGVALGHRRLAVIDLSPAGHQPMISASGRYVLTYNGEIYNWRSLRAELAAAGHRFRGSSDTEVLLAAIDQWGLTQALRRANGMFALALWDARASQLHLARDRLGEKPLYYTWANTAFLFASELKALPAHPDFVPEIDRDALALFFRHGCIPAPYSVYEGVWKLLPGTVLTVSGAGRRTDAQPVPYWSARAAAEAGAAHPLEASPAEMTDQLEAILADAVQLRIHADVPLGGFLSGGIDSSTVVALMQAASNARVKTFTVALDDPAYDESAGAGAVAAHLGTDHVELRISPADAMDVVPRLPEMYDEPFSDSSQVPTFLVSQLARRHVTVSLSGDGGDELFGGYNRYAWGPAIWNRMRWFPRPVRSTLATGLRMPRPRAWDVLFDWAGPVLPQRLRVRYPGAKMSKIAAILPSATLDEMYRRLVSHTPDPTGLVLGATEPPTLVGKEVVPRLDDPVARMMYLDAVSYLPDDILVKLDRASMAVSLEARVPMLDHRVAEFAWRLPMEMKVRNGQGKWLLRQVLYRHVPRRLVDRPKAGFGIPLGDWLRSELRDWAEPLLDASRVQREGFLSPTRVRELWESHVSGRRNASDELWDILMFQSWLERSWHRSEPVSAA